MLVEANETFLKKDKALVDRSLVQASKNVFVRAMTPSADTQIIYPGTILAQVSPVQEVVNPNSKIDEDGELRTYLINLLERSQEHLIPKQCYDIWGSTRWLFYWMCRPFSNVILYYVCPSIIAI
jgi:hypothetical protein